VNFRFPEIFGVVLMAVLLCSFALPRSVSGRVENTFQFLFAPVAGPIQWMTSNAATPTRPDVPILTNITDETTRLKEEKLAALVEMEYLRGQIETLRFRAQEAERVGEALRDIVVPVKVLQPDGNGRDVLRLGGASTPLVIEKGCPVIFEAGVVGKIQEVGLGKQSSVRLITDKGFKTLARFGRPAQGSVKLEMLALGETIVEGHGNGEMRIDSLPLSDVQKAGLQVHDLVLLSDLKSIDWPIEVHGYRLGAVSYVGERTDAAGVAEIRVRPERDLTKLKDVWILGKKG
jgi:rod shape-determining protein MreC